MKKIGELNTRAAWFVLYYDDSDKHGNRYKIYQKWYEHGWHKKKVEAYGDLWSCTIWVNEFVSKHNEETRG